MASLSAHSKLLKQPSLGTELCTTLHQGKAGDKASKDLQDKLREAKQENRELQNRIRALEMELKKGGGMGGPDIEVGEKLGSGRLCGVKWKLVVLIVMRAL